MNDDLLNEKTTEAIVSLGIETEDTKKLVQERMKHEHEIQLHNYRVEYAKAFKKRKTDDEIMSFKRAIVEELVTQWSQESLALRIPGIVVSGLAIHVAQFFKDNVKRVPHFPTYDEMVDWVEGASTYLNALDKHVFWFIKMTLGTEGTQQIAYATLKENEIGPSSRLIHMFKKDTLFFFGTDVWAFFLNNENIIQSPEFEMIEHIELLSTGKVGKYRGTTLLTDGFRHPHAKCLEKFEGFFISIPLIQTASQPKLDIVVAVSPPSPDRIDVPDEIHWYKEMTYKVTGEDFVKHYCKRIVMT